MKKIAFFVEGQTEVIFIEEFLYQFLGYEKTTIKTTSIHGKTIFINAKKLIENKNYEYYFLVVNTGSDKMVGTTIRKNMSNMLGKEGFNRLFAVRDVFSPDEGITH